MNVNSGWIKLHRKITDWEWYTDLPVKTLYIHLLLKANHADARWQGTEVRRGEMITSTAHLARETGLSLKQVRTALEKLKKSGEITSKGTNRYTLIKCCNYGVYQSAEPEQGQSDGNPSANGGHARGNKQEYNNYKNKKTCKRMKRKPSFDIEEIALRAKLNDDYDI